MKNDVMKVYDETRPVNWPKMPYDEYINNNEIYLLVDTSRYISFIIDSENEYTIQDGEVIDGKFTESNFIETRSNFFKQDKKEEGEIKIIKISSNNNIKAFFTGLSGILEIKCRMTECEEFNIVNSYHLKFINWLDTNKISSMCSLFENCRSLITILNLNTSNIINMDSMFKGCGSLITIPEIITDKVTDMTEMFNNCKNLVSIPYMNISNVENVHSMFRNCFSLVNVPQLDTSKAINMHSMFRNCFSLTNKPQLNTSKAINTNHIFDGCKFK